MMRHYEIYQRHPWGGGWNWGRCVVFEDRLRLGETTELFYITIINKIAHPLEQGTLAAIRRDKDAAEARLFD